MAIDITAVRNGLAANLAALASTGGMLQVSAFMLANPEPPCLHIFPAAIEYDETFGRGQDRLRFIVQAMVAFASDNDGQSQLDKYLASSGAASVKGLIEADRTLGGTVSSCQVKTNSGYKVFAVQNRPDMLGCDWTVEAIAPG